VRRQPRGNNDGEAGDHLLLSKAFLFVLLALAVAGCDDWMLGTYSSTPNEVGVMGVDRYEFRGDGTLIRTAVMGCGEKQREVREEYKWRAEGPSLMIVADIREGDSVEDWHIRRGEACNTIEVERVVGEKVQGTFSLRLGAVCMYELPPCEINCEACDTKWCDEPPPECED
jgi:hypothetical protein